jgi:ribosomal protein L13E
MFRQIGNAVPPGLACVIAKQILKILEFLETVLNWIPKVKSQSQSPNKKFRRGRGFSLAELKAAGIELWQAMNEGVPIDKRRKSKHKVNVDRLMKLQTSTHN